MIKDLRKQKRTIIVKFEKIGYDFDLDKVVDNIVKEIEIVSTQRQWVDKDKIKIEITLK